MFMSVANKLFYTNDKVVLKASGKAGKHTLSSHIQDSSKQILNVSQRATLTATTVQQAW
jgi:hypothetical protein